MLPVSRPALQTNDVFNACCDGIRNVGRRTRLTANASLVAQAANDYAAAGLAGSIHALKGDAYSLVASATPQDFVWLYDHRLVGHHKGRVSYQLIRDGNRNGRCALCNVSRAASLDHHLPKTEHPVFALTPDNLVPACQACNHTKLANQIPTLNPYFDDLGGGPWLKAEVIRATPPAFDFRVEPQSDWSPSLLARARSHFELFDLRGTYAFEAVRHASGIRGRLSRILVLLGEEGVRGHLRDEAESWAAAEPNSWQAALYVAMAESAWFCAGGFDG